MLAGLLDRRPRALLVAWLACLIGCSTDDDASEEIPTRRFHAAMSVRAESPGLSRVRVHFQVDDPLGANIELTGGDRLEASVAGLTQVLIEDNRFFSIDYVTRFGTSSDADPFQIRLIRTDGSVIEDSFVRLRPEFVVTSPVERQLASFGSDLLLAWSPADVGQTMLVQLSTSCRTTTGGLTLATSSLTLDDDGSELFDLGRLRAATDPAVDRSQPCRLDLDFQRRATGSLDPAFEAGGSISSTQSREVEEITLLY